MYPHTVAAAPSEIHVWTVVGLSGVQVFISFLVCQVLKGRKCRRGYVPLWTPSPLPLPTVFKCSDHIHHKIKGKVKVYNLHTKLRWTGHTLWWNRLSRIANFGPVCGSGGRAGWLLVKSPAPVEVSLSKAPLFLTIWLSACIYDTIFGVWMDVRQYRQVHCHWLKAVH